VHDHAAARLGEILAGETRELRRLLDLLGEEQVALRKADAAAVMSSLRAQEATLSRIRVLEGERAQVLAALATPKGLDPATLTLSRLVEAWPDAAEALAAVREDLRALLDEVRRLNDRNAVLVRRGLGFVDRLVAHLAVALAPEHAPAYSAQGRTTTLPSLGLVDRTA
jgi:flagellar biosynthesis/type III secretory pathway chaperone